MKIWWRVRTLSMFAAMTLILVLIGMLISVIFINNIMVGAGIMIVISLVICFISYYKSKDLALMHAKARIITEAENPRLFSIVRDVAGRASLATPATPDCVPRPVHP